MASVRKNIDNSNNSKMLGSAFCAAYDVIVTNAPPSVVDILKAEFHPIFTFVVALPLQMMYLLYILPGSPESNFITMHIHLIVLVFGTAALRCLMGYLITGKDLKKGTYDYPAPGDTVVKERGSQKMSKGGMMPKAR